MKINKNWEPSFITCPCCEKKFEVRYETNTNDNCLPVINDYNLERILNGHVDQDSWADEKTLQWFDIRHVLYICPHCHNFFGSNESCRVCHKPVYSWFGHMTGITCGSDRCAKISSVWLKKGGIPRESLDPSWNVLEYEKRLSNLGDTKE